MGRYLRLYAHFLRFSFSRAMEFRLDFFFRVVMDAVWYAVNLAFFTVIYRHTTLLGGWDYDQVVVFAAGLFFVDAIHMTVLSNNMWWFPQLVNRGDLDYYLVRPVSPLFFVSLREFAANSFLNLVIASGILAWSLARHPAGLGVGDAALYVGLLLVGAALHYALVMTFLIPVFWIHAAHGLRDVSFALDRFMGRPDGVFRGWVRRLLVSLLPYALIVSYPCRALFGERDASLFLHVFGVTAAAFLLMNALWRLGLRTYSSASS
jgi:ABC-2 type transport system permease protein